jgi:hypothetical protein
MNACQRTFIDDNNANERLQHLGNKPNALVALMMHDRLVPAARCAVARAPAGADGSGGSSSSSSSSSGSDSSSSGSSGLLPLVVVPAEEGAARLARLEAEVAVRVRKVGEHARADDAGERVTREVECLEGVQCEDERRDVCRGRWLLQHIYIYVSVGSCREHFGGEGLQVRRSVERV